MTIIKDYNININIILQHKEGGALIYFKFLFICSFLLLHLASYHTNFKLKILWLKMLMPTTLKLNYINSNLGNTHSCIYTSIKSNMSIFTIHLSTLLQNVQL